MTNEALEALDTALRQWKMYSEILSGESGDLDEEDTPEAILYRECKEALKAALTPPDVEALKKTHQEIFLADKDITNEQAYFKQLGYNQAIDHLAAQGHLVSGKSPETVNKSCCVQQSVHKCKQSAKNITDAGQHVKETPEDLHDAITIIEQHQKWRKGCEITPPTQPKKLTEALDVALNIMNRTKNADICEDQNQHAQKSENCVHEPIEGLGDAIYYVETDRCVALNDDGTQKPSSKSYELMNLVRAARRYLAMTEAG